MQDCFKAEASSRAIIARIECAPTPTLDGNSVWEQLMLHTSMTEQQ